MPSLNLSFLKRKITAVSLVIIMAFTGTSVFFPGVAEQKVTDKVPRQVVAHVGSPASTEIRITYTTSVKTKTRIVYNKVGSKVKKETTGTNKVGASKKCFHKIILKGLMPNTRYIYTIGEGSNTFKGTFKTAPGKGDRKAFQFAYIADTQVSGATDARALGASFTEVSKKDYDFVFLAGDITNRAKEEKQWERLFQNGGLYPNGGRNLFGNHTVAVVRGNHDDNAFANHIGVPAKAGKAVYSFDYGPATFVMLNLETANGSKKERNKQAKYLRTIVKEAKSRKQWIVVCFHKSLYSGASHITDTDVVKARKYWHPLFVELDVDLVLQGHDHVYSRGFVDEKGKRKMIARNGGFVKNPSGAPLYVAGGHVGGLKWYAKKNYKVGKRDPITANYAFLNRNSNDDKINDKEEQCIVEVQIDQASYTIKTYMMKYDSKNNRITTKKYLYDSITVKR